MSSGITSQNGQTQTEERKMDVRGCTKGRQRKRGRTEGGRRHHRDHRVCSEGQSEEGEDGRLGGRGDTTQQQYDRTMTKQAQNT